MLFKLRNQLHVIYICIFCTI
ncbi:SVM family protein [Belliella pelovolcani]